MTNNTPDYNNNLFFDEKKMDCKNCPYTDEYCASGDCERNAGVCKTLTEKWEKGELLEGFYFVDDGAEVTIDYYLCDYWERHYDSDIKQVLAPVPTYKELNEILESEEKSHLQADSYYNKILELKELLKEIKGKIKMYYDDSRREFYSSAEFSDDLIKKIDEVLK